MKYSLNASHASVFIKLHNKNNNNQLCSLDDCLDESAFASFDYFVEHLRLDETNLDEEQLQSGTKSRTRNSTSIWLKSDCSFFTIKNINIEKKFEEFLSEIGGNFGLFAGASILTFVEIGVFFVKIFKVIFFNRQGSKISINPTIDRDRF